MLSPLESTESAKNSLARVTYTHDAMIDLIILNPGIHQNEIAKHFGYTPAWISRVMCSDAFNARLAERRGNSLQPILATFEEKLKGLADQSLEVLSEKLNTVKDPNLAVKALELSTRALGYGARQTNVAVQTSFVVAIPGKIDNADDWAKTHSPSAIQVEVVNG